MAKSKRALAAPNARPNIPPALALDTILFPDLSPKSNLACRVLLEDQVLLIDNLFSAEECKRLVKFIDDLPLELTPPKKRGEADRVNYRISIPSPSFASTLFTILSPHLPAFLYPASSKRRPAIAPSTHRDAHSLNSNIRLYKYTPSQHFGPHYDDSVTDAHSGAKSEWTLLVYLTGAEDGVRGGETVFYTDGVPRDSKKPGPAGREDGVVRAPLVRGTALLHRHGRECLLHEGSRVEAGEKYILRSDVMFMN